MFELPIDTPPALARRPRTFNGFPIPWFAANVDGQLDIRVASAERHQQALRERRCWVCGERWKAPWFVIGPMCAVNRNTAEPPCCEACARFSVKYCPFLTKPAMRRNERDLPGGAQWSETGLKRNPGGVVLWSSSYLPYRIGTETLIRLGDPVAVEWFSKGAPIGRAEAQALVDAGAPALREVAEQGGPSEVAVLDYLLSDVRRFLPEAEIEPQRRPGSALRWSTPAPSGTTPT